MSTVYLPFVSPKLSQASVWAAWANFCADSSMNSTNNSERKESEAVYSMAASLRSHWGLQGTPLRLSLDSREL